MTQKCNCEHVRHFPLSEVPEFADTPRDAHAYLSVDAGEKKADLIGLVCDECADVCVPDWIDKPKDGWSRCPRCECKRDRTYQHPYEATCDPCREAIMLDPEPDFG